MVTSFSERFKEALRIRGMSAAELSRLTKTPESVISQYKKGDYEPKQRRLEAFSKVLNVSIPWLMGADVPMDKTDAPYTPEKKGVKIPVLGRVAAGVPIDAIEDIIDYEEITEEMARTGDFFGLQIQGDSMEPKISDGDVVIVRKTPCVDSGQTAIVLINGQDATCKKVIRHETGISLVSTNPAYEPRFFSAKEIDELPIMIIGKVVELRAKFE